MRNFTILQPFKEGITFVRRNTDASLYSLQQIALEDLSETQTSLFVAGVATMARIHHRNVKRIFDYIMNKSSKRILILSELCGAGSLYSINSELCSTLARPSVSLIEDSFVQLIIAIQYIHRHLDGPMKRRPLVIDPKSVYFTDSGILKIDLIQILIYNQEPVVRDCLFGYLYGEKSIDEQCSNLTRYLASEARSSRFFTEKSSIYSAGKVIRELISPWGWEGSSSCLVIPPSPSLLDITSGSFKLQPELLALLDWSCNDDQRDRPNSDQLLARMASAGFLNRAEQRQGIVRLNDGSTLLMRAVKRDDPTSARLAIGQAGLLNNDGLTALMIAAIFNHISVAKLLLKREAFFTSDNYVLRGWRFSNCTALMLGAAHGSVGVCRLLRPIEGGLQTSNGWTALMYAAGCKQVATTTLLLPVEAGLCTNQLSSFGSGFTALMSAAYNDSYETCRLLINAEANMFTTLDNKKYPRWSALVFAAAVCSVNCVKVLVEHEAEQFGSLALQSIGKLSQRKSSERQKIIIHQQILRYIKQPRDINLTNSLLTPTSPQLPIINVPARTYATRSKSRK